MPRKEMRTHYKDLEAYLIANNRQQFTCVQLAIALDTHQGTIWKWAMKLIDNGLIEIVKISRTTFYRSSDYRPEEKKVIEKFIGEVVQPRTFRPEREYKPDLKMRQVIERLDLSRHIKAG